jgi:hypothetical protein
VEGEQPAKRRSSFGVVKLKKKEATKTVAEQADEEGGGEAEGASGGASESSGGDSKSSLVSAPHTKADTPARRSNTNAGREVAKQAPANEEAFEKGAFEKKEAALQQQVQDVKAEAEMRDTKMQRQLDKMKADLEAAQEEVGKTAALLKDQEVALQQQVVHEQLSNKKDAEGQMQHMLLKKENAKQATLDEHRLEESEERKKAEEEKQAMRAEQETKKAKAEQERGHCETKDVRVGDEKRAMQQLLKQEKAEGGARAAALLVEVTQLKADAKRQAAKIQLWQTELQLAKKEMPEKLSLSQTEKRQLELQINAMVKAAKGGGRGEWDKGEGGAVVLKAKKMAAKKSQV